MPCLKTPRLAAFLRRGDIRGGSVLRENICLKTPYPLPIESERSERNHRRCAGTACRLSRFGSPRRRSLSLPPSAEMPLRKHPLKDLALASQRMREATAAPRLAAFLRRGDIRGGSALKESTHLKTSPPLPRGRAKRLPHRRCRLAAFPRRGNIRGGSVLRENTCLKTPYPLPIESERSERNHRRCAGTACRLSRFGSPRRHSLSLPPPAEVSLWKIPA